MTRLIKHFSKFFKPIKCDDNNDIIETDLGLQDIREEVNDETKPMTIRRFLDEIDDLVQQVKTSYDKGTDESDIGREYVNEACHLQDTALTMVMNCDSKLVEDCEAAYKRWENNMKNQKEDLEKKEKMI